MKVHAPVKVTGRFASVNFVNGVGETDNPALLSWFKAHGYKITKGESVKTKDNGIKLKKEEIPDNIEDFTPYELRRWVADHNLNDAVGTTRNKGAILNIIRSCVEDES